jgi:hypothetical protein
VIVDDPDQVHWVHSLELEGEDVDLPERVRQLALEAPNLGWASAWSRRRIAETRVVDHRPDLLRAHRETFVASQLVADPTHTPFGMFPSVCKDPFLEL